MTLTMSWLFVSVGLIWLFQKLLMSRVDKEWSEKRVAIVWVKLLC